MRQAIRILIVLAATAPVALAGDPSALEQAKGKVAAKDFKAAASLLEDALAATPPPAVADRDAMIGLLKESYRGLIQNARAAGSTREAASYEDDLAILESSAPDPKSSETPVPTPPPADPPPAAKPAEPPPAEPAPDPKPSEPPAPTPPPPADPAAKPKPAEAPAPAPPPPADAAAKPAEAPAPTPPPAEAAPKADAPLELPLVGPVPAAEPAEKPPTSRSIDPNVARAADVPDPSPAAPDELDQADALFKEKKYEEAGAIYATLARAGRLPTARNKVWAYCRWNAIVARINAGPRSDAEWDLIEREVQNVERLTPDHWFVDYLKDLVADVRSGKRHVPKTGRGPLAVRGAEPDDDPAPRPAPAARRPKADPQARPAGGALDLPAGDDLPAPAPVPPVERLAPPLDSPEPEPEAAATPAAAAAPVAWRTQETDNFRIFHVDPDLAEKAAEAAEAVRATQAKRWGSPATRAAWEPKCDIYLYPTAADFARMTGQPETSPGFSTMGIGGGKVVARRVNLRADHPQLIAAVLPHEVAHVVLADVFPDQQIPRWADEGMAVLAEPPAEQVGRCSELGAPLADNRVFPLETLMTTDYPEAKDWNLYYAQSVSLTRFLMAQGGPSKFVAFVKDSQQRGPDTALRATYRIAGFKDLEARWRDHATREADRLAAAADPAATTR